MNGAGVLAVAAWRPLNVHPKAILNMNECRDSIMESSSLVDGKMTFVCLPATSLRARFSATSLFTVTHYSLSDLTISHHILSTFTDFFEVVLH